MGNDYFQFKQFTIRQSRCAMKVGTDGTLLGAWAGFGDGCMVSGDGSIDPTPELSSPHHSPFTPHPSPLTPPQTILDVGTGTGLIALMMAQRFPQARVVGIDIDEEAVAQARENVATSPFADRVEILHEDFAVFPSRRSNLNSRFSNLNSQFSVIVSNPPYFADSLKNPDARRSLARHADALPYRTLMQRAWQLLSDDGELSVVVPADYKGRMEAEAALAGFFKSRECSVRTSPSKPVKRWLLAFRRHPAPLKRDELTLGTERCNELTKDFYL